MTVQGRLLAEGAETNRIHLSLQPGDSQPWSGIEFTASATTHSLSHVDFQGCSGAAIQAAQTSLILDHARFSECAGVCLQISDSSFHIRDSVFPAQQDAITMDIFRIPTDGFAIISGNEFGKPLGTKEVIRFSGGRLPGTILQVLNNRFHGGGGSLLNISDADAHIEGNLFQHALGAEAQRNMACAIAAGASAGNSMMIVRNIFHDCDCMVQSFGDTFFSVQHNTVYRMSRAGLILNSGACELDGNILWETPVNVIAASQASGQGNVAIRRSILSGPDHRGPDCLSLDPAFRHPPAHAGDAIQAGDFQLRPNSPAIGTGPNGWDMGACVPPGISVSGEPGSTTTQTSAILRISGPGVTHYRYRLDEAFYGMEQPVEQPIELLGLVEGVHRIEVLGKNFAGVWQTNTPLSMTWTIDPAWNGPPAVRINEVLSHATALDSEGYSGMIELFNPSETALDLAGMTLSKSLTNPGAFVFQPGSWIPGNGFLVMSDKPDPNGSAHALPFAMESWGGSLYLFDTLARGRMRIDSVVFGRQLANRSIGRLADANWGLTVPTPGRVNIAQPLSDTRLLKINEWRVESPYAAGFVELYNPESLPASLSGLILLAQPTFLPSRPAISGLSYIDAWETVVTTSSIRDKSGIPCPSLSPVQGAIGLFEASGQRIDVVLYDSPVAHRSQGRSPDGSATVGFFDMPTPGTGNPGFYRASSGAVSASSSMRINEVMAASGGGGNPDIPGWLELHNASSTNADLSDMSLSMDPNNPRQWVFPVNTSLEPGGYLTIACDPLAPISPLSTGLARSGASIFFFASPAQGTRLIDAVAFGMQAPGYAIGRNEASAWVLTTPTPGGKNVPAILGDPRSLRLNEWMANPIAGGDWFEIHNAGANPVSLENLFFTDDLQQRQLFPIAPLSFTGTGASAFQTFQADAMPELGAGHVGFKLEAGGEELGLFDAGGSQIDAVRFGPQWAGISQGRFPDGHSTLVLFLSQPTPGSANSADTGDMDSDSDGIPDYWEIAHGLEPGNPTDSAWDADRDGLTNLQEYQSGTDPLNPLSYLGFTACRAAEDGFLLVFYGMPGRTYTIDSRDDLLQGPWLTLQTLGPFNIGQECTFKDTTATARNRYYRLSTPASQPQPLN
jgi:hypothetical protein